MTYEMKTVEQNTLKRRGVGLRACNPARACPGFTLFAPRFQQNRTVYLIDLQGEIAHTWQLPYPPLSGYLTERGTLFYNGRTSEDSFLSRSPFKGGVVLEADWNGKVLWEVHHPQQHHHAILLRSGNVLLHCLGRVPDDIAKRVTGGTADHALPSALYAPRPEAEADIMYSDYLAELTPAGETVWEWRTWEHLDPVEDGFAEVQAIRRFWALGNGVAELPDGDILASYRPISTVIRIARKTGQILWKIGSPTLAGQHAPTPLENGNILIFDNGVHRLDDPLPFSRVIEINPATKEIVWTYQDRPVTNFFTPRMGNAQRLPNGNTLINEASFGRFFEVTEAGEIVWEYVNPFFGGPSNAQVNEVFRVYRYTAEEIARARRTA
ncbi:MAG TPA: aryl-sulfate sulfotransferase [Candidatus Acidoferrales bacterium]|nr:aryl-sulfate sulfotransferase [Candidatus Acidoferrales bacterium]